MNATAAPARAPSPPAPDRVVIRETRRTGAVSKVAVGLFGLFIAAAFASFQSSLKVDPDALPWVVSATAFAVVTLGVGTLMAWRKSGAFEAVEVRDRRVQLIIAPYKKPFFDAPLESTRIQRFVLPQGSLKLFLRDGVKAVELGADLDDASRTRLADQLDRLVGAQAPARPV